MRTNTFLTYSIALGFSSLALLFLAMVAEGAAQGQLFLTDPALRGMARLLANVLACGSGAMCLAFIGTCVWHRTQEKRRARLWARSRVANYANREVR